MEMLQRMKMNRGTTMILLAIAILCFMSLVNKFQVHELQDHLGEDWIGKYKRNLKSGSSNTTVDCVSWEPVEILQHNQAGRGGQSWMSEQKVETESSEHRKESFAKIWEDNVWGGEVKSGLGSLLINAKKVIDALNILIEKIKKKTGKDQISFLDSSCGDMTWMPTFLGNRTDVDFTGYDIVPANIENHKEKFASKSWKFEVHDLVADTIPKFDLILSRHTMMHLKTDDNIKVLKNFYDSGSTYLLATNFPEIETNVELSENESGRYRQINLHLAPFYLPPPVCQTDNDGNINDLYIAFWMLEILG